MTYIANIIPYIQIVVSILLIVTVLLQQSGSSLGGAFGGADDVTSKRTRRGFEKTLFNTTIVLVILFVLFSVLDLLV